MLARLRIRGFVTLNSSCGTELEDDGANFGLPQSAARIEPGIEPGYHIRQGKYSAL